MSGNNSESVKEFQRLPKSVIPRHYTISIKPDLTNFTFTGNQVIGVEVTESTQLIVLNALELEISNAKFKASNGEFISASGVTFSKEEESAQFTFASKLETGAGELHLDFSGSLNDKLKGFYRSKYTTHDGEVRYAATTHFEPTNARRAFPCFDEPSLRATFDITLIVPKDKVALSNMNVVQDKESASNPNYREVRFATSPIMSTYLVAFIVGEYDYVETTSSDGVLVRVYTPVGKKEQGIFALEVAAKTLPYYSKYFNIPYHLPKIDLIAIADFPIGAMENWGLVTYRETCLLVDPKHTPADRKQHVALVVCHELAHQWFGNLVTIEWWTHLWLKEGFASWIEFLCVDNLFPEYDIWTQFVTDTYNKALELDALHNSHPIEVPVGHPSEIREIFDDISYNKGAAVIRMLYNYVGDENFRKGLGSYLNQHKYKSTQTEDLWESLEKASNLPVGDVMSTWTKQKGFPVITVTARQDGNSRILKLSQEKFCADGKLPAADASCRWLIPISISTAASPNKAVIEILMETQTLEVIIPNVASHDWVKLNPGTIGLYRVQYSAEMLDLLLPAVKNKTLPPLDRLGLQNDVFAMVQAGRSSTVNALKLMDAFANEDNYTVWNSINACLGKLNILLSHTEYQSLFHAFGRQMFGKVHSRLGWDAISDESHLDTLLRSLIINRLAVFEDPLVLKEAKKRFDAQVAGTCVIPADLKSAVYRAVAIDCDEKTFNTLFNLYKDAEMHEEKDRIACALGSVKDEDRIKKVLDFSLSSDVRSQDTVFVIISVAMTKPGREMAWKFIKENKEELGKRCDGGLLLCRLVKYGTENFASEEKAQEVEAFFASENNKFPGTERTVQQSLETIRLHSGWLGRDSAAIQAYLSSRV